MTKAADLEQLKQLRERAKQTVAQFVRRFDESYRLLAYHAALPLVLTPELVNYLRNEFLRGEEVPWIAEVDLLLSDLCSQVGYELYAMDTHVRAYLLEQMEQDPRFGKRRMQEVARVLYSYVSYLSRLNPGRRQQEIEAQRWAAMVYLGDEQCKAAAREIAERLLETSSGTGLKSLTESGIKAELARLTRITEELSPQLKEEPSLLEYARLVQKILRTSKEVNPADVDRSYQVEDVELRFPDRLLPEPLAKTVAASRVTVTQLEGFPPIKTFTFEVATIFIEDETETSLGINLQPFEFEVALIEVDRSARINTDNALEMVDEEVFSKTGKSLNDLERLVVQGTFANQTYEEIAASAAAYSVHHLKNVGIKLWKVLSEVFGEKVTKRNLQNVLEQWVVARRRPTINRHRQQAQCFIEDLGNGVQLEMVAIPEGSFLMGSPKNELERSDWESPRHRVTIQSFFLGKYPVTQAQWQAVASFPKVNRELEPDPSSFKDDYEGIDRWQRPVEQVSWYDAVEFCDRLSQYTGRPYGLPSEAEWEYACRAGTDTPFHFGETISTELANYNGNYTYGEGVKGEYREQTTPVGYFKVANAFGLYDLHGNVWEWCEDDWHSNYEGAPTDGSAWLSESGSTKVIRGGSWAYYPNLCRSAYRYGLSREHRSSNIGFRVVCVAPRTQ
jgi:formylglycine-generating enzyme required for sulfatase activity